MKVRRLLGVAVLCSITSGGALAVDLNAVPELPPDLADGLTRVGESSWLGNGRVRNKMSLIPPLHRDERQCWSVDYFTAQITYPRTYCVPPRELSTLMSKREADSLGPTGASKDGNLRVHRFSSIKDQLLGCVTRSGPWLAEISHHQNCDGTDDHFLAPFNGFQPVMPGGGRAFPPFEWDGGSQLPPNYGWLTDPVPWSVPFRGGRCTFTQMTQCPGEHVGQIPGDEPDPPIIY